MPGVSEERPLWRQGFDALEAAVGPRLTAAAASEPFAIAVGLAARAQHSVQQRVERTSRRLLHLANLPTENDMTRVLSEIAQLRRQVLDLSRRLEASRELGSPRRATSTGRARGGPGDDRRPD